jgi:PadR family transcriptional regulator
MAIDQLRGHLDLLILSVVADGPKHGYAIISELAKRSDSKFDLPEGTVYPALHRLERRGLLMSSWDLGGARRRRNYELTEVGRSSFATEKREWTEMITGIQSVLAWT